MGLFVLTGAHDCGLMIPVIGKLTQRCVVFSFYIVQVFAVKTWGELASYDDYSGSVTGVKFGKSSSFLVRQNALGLVCVYRSLSLARARSLSLPLFPTFFESVVALSFANQTTSRSAYDKRGTPTHTSPPPPKLVLVDMMLFFVNEGATSRRGALAIISYVQTRFCRNSANTTALPPPPNPWCARHPVTWCSQATSSMDRTVRFFGSV